MVGSNNLLLKSGFYGYDDNPIFGDSAETVSYSLVPKTNKERIGALTYALLGGVPFLSLNAAVQFVPMGDIVALSAMCPIFAYLIARIVLKQPLTFLKVCITYPS